MTGDTIKRALGVCYYPEHWPREIWAEDAAQMKALGLTYVRIGEFAWSRLEPKEGQLEFDWLDEAINVLGKAGLKVVLGTPTATPPRWMISKHPDMLALDAHGDPRKFGSRRHYCFSHAGYRQECERIVSLLAERYGANEFICAWQTDNEYGCHDTIHSYSDAARVEFQDWLRDHYRNEDGKADIQVLNEAWGNVFWSMEYSDFAEIDLPNLTVTEANPSHNLAFKRFSSDQVKRFNRLQTDIIRKFSDAPISHNYMGRTTEFDHFAVGEDLDFATWDSYPLGFLEDRITAEDSHKHQFARQGDADFQAFHHDLYRAVGKGRWWVMEQQPGPVNWAPHNPAPLPGMVRLWAWEAFAHGAETVSFFRWRQAPFAQEQLHAGLLRPDNEKADGYNEVVQVAIELGEAPDVSFKRAPVAILFDYEADFAWAVQPHGQGLNYFDLVFNNYQALRSLGLSVDILPSTARDFDDYAIVVAPGLIHMPDELKEALQRFADESGTVVLGPRSASRTQNMRIPVPLPPAISGFPCMVTSVQSMRDSQSIPLKDGGLILWYQEMLDHNCEVIQETEDGEPVVIGSGNMIYVAGWLDMSGLRSLYKPLLVQHGMKVLDLPRGVRLRETATETFWFNYDTVSHTIEGQTFSPTSVTRIA